MFIPERDISRPLSGYPFVLITIIAANIAVFLAEVVYGNSFVLRYSLKPAEIVRGEHLETLITSMFMHANLIHIAGNMLYLWVFGDELEANYLGAARFAVFYFMCGLAASVLQIAVDPASTVPNLGASGAIAGILAGFLLIFPRDEILVLILTPFGIGHTRFSALIWIGLWFGLQIVGGFGTITSAATGGVAYFAHIGGFVAGAILVRIVGTGRRPVGQIRV